MTDKNINRNINKNIWDEDLNEIKYSKESNNNYFKKYRTGSVRIALGMVCTKEDFEAKKKEVLSYKF